ncbi:MAG: hypothetical protein DRQ49_10085 [Gammaproteobacteria bacterium]|nr:MAG: hypothetical protein DRQ49_10085 [Gammaproteobacteria bacterium]RKZ45374.1 MAG: hypothetical protein DRQ41_00425 [Gammaproteobacteria bacterium]RKZ74806.1 MAG: hypothetical protein DRQ57_09730 [Gammaproteobacteria bacterium]
MKKSVLGFTLIELMITVVIMSILAAIAIPSYNKFLIKSRRSDAKIALLGLAQAQTIHYTEYRKYAANLGNAVANKTIRCRTFCVIENSQALSPDGHYKLSIGFRPGGSILTSFRLTATARGQQDIDDTECHTLSLDSLNNKTSTDNASSPPGNSDRNNCWGNN